MAGNNIDRLFREKLDQVEMTPAETSWDQVKKRIEKKTYWKASLGIAAAVVVLIGATLIFKNNPTQTTQQFISSIDQPTQNPLYIPEIPEKTMTKTQEPATARTSVQNPREMNPREGKLVIEPFRLARMEASLYDEGVQQPELIATTYEADQPTVRITYIATQSAEPAMDTARSITLKKVLALAKEVTTADLLADIREAKDNLFDRN